MLSLSVEIAFGKADADRGQKIIAQLASQLAQATDGFFPAKHNVEKKATNIDDVGSLDSVFRAPIEATVRIISADTSQPRLTISVRLQKMRMLFTVDLVQSVNLKAIENSVLRAFQDCLEQDLQMQPYCGMAILGTKAGDFASGPKSSSFSKEGIFDLVNKEEIAAAGFEIQALPGEVITTQNETFALLDWTCGDDERSPAKIESFLLGKRATLIGLIENENLLPFEIGSALPHALASLYDPVRKQAFLTAHDSETQQVIVEKVALLQDWISRKQIDRESPVLEAYLITSSIGLARKLKARFDQDVRYLVASDDGLGLLA